MESAGKYSVLGIMSGTSLDGVDLACCEFRLQKNAWKYSVLATETIGYSQEWKKILEHCYHMSSFSLIRTDHHYGKYLAGLIHSFIIRHHLKPDLIASHGHTVFHRPDEHYSLQIGNGNDIASATGIAVVYDFRSMDISLGGQGAPLVPFGDKQLFPEYDICLNLGGFSNISYDQADLRIAFDICPVNILLNDLAASLNKEYDKNGESGKKGKVDKELLENLENISYYRSSPPKSMGREHIDSIFKPLLDKTVLSIEDKLRTFYEHISHRIADTINHTGKKNVLVTGGGAKNVFLRDLIKQKTKADIILPDNTTIDYKEAIIFAFLGLLRKMHMINCYASVTGAKRDSVCGVLVEPK